MWKRLVTSKEILERRTSSYITSSLNRDENVNNVSYERLERDKIF
jgi:hypothetical protein